MAFEIIDRAGNSTGGRAHGPTAMLGFVLLDSLMSALPIIETQKSHGNGKNDGTVWDLGP